MTLEIQTLIKRESKWMDHKTLFPVLEMGFSFWISKWNIQFGLDADFGKVHAIS